MIVLTDSASKNLEEHDVTVQQAKEKISEYIPLGLELQQIILKNI